MCFICCRVLSSDDQSEALVGCQKMYLLLNLVDLVRTLCRPSTPPQKRDHTRRISKNGELCVAYCIQPTFEQREDLQLSSEVAQLSTPGRSIQVALIKCDCVVEKSCLASAA